MVNAMELSQLRLTGPVLAIKKTRFEGQDKVALDFALADAGGGFKAIRINLDPEKAKAGDKRHSPDEYAVGTVVDLPVMATVNFKSGALSLRISDLPAEATREATRPVVKPSLAAMKTDSPKVA